MTAVGRQVQRAERHPRRTLALCRLQAPLSSQPRPGFNTVTAPGHAIQRKSRLCALASTTDNAETATTASNKPSSVMPPPGRPHSSLNVAKPATAPRHHLTGKHKFASMGHVVTRATTTTSKPLSADTHLYAFKDRPTERPSKRDPTLKTDSPKPPKTTSITPTSAHQSPSTTREQPKSHATDRRAPAPPTRRAQCTAQ